MRSKEEHKKGNRLYGYFFEQDNGVKIYLAIRTERQLYTNRVGSVSKAIRQDDAGWAIDTSTLALAKRRGVTVIGVKSKNTGRYYFATLEAYFTPTKTKLIDWTERGGSIQRMLPLSEFKQIHYKIHL
tara:strand:- start:3120 stop:3503 length:384 start_codon:yes stop_codon:yes gene_type:complete